METINALKSFGLSEKEARVYMAGLELGRSSAGEIAIRSNSPRTLVYDLLDKLIAIGLTTYSISENKKLFTMADPKTLIEILDSKKELIKEALPTLKKLTTEKAKKRPKVEIYEGKEGIRTLMNLALRSDSKEIYIYGGSRSFWDLDPYFVKHWHNERLRKKIHLFRTFDDLAETRNKIKKFKESLKLTSYRFLPSLAKAPTPVMIIGNMVALIHLEKTGSYAVLIEDKSMAENHRGYFQQLWKVAKK